MNSKAAETLLRCHRPRSNDLQDGRIKKAIRVAERDEQLKATWHDQRVFDEQVVGAIQTIKPPPSLQAVHANLVEEAGSTDTTLRGLLRQPALLAVCIGTLVVVGVLVYLRINQLDDFPGKDAAAQMISTTDQMSGMELEPVATEAGKLGDWFFLKYGLDHYNVPPEFSHLTTAGCRVFKQGGFPIAQIAVTSGNRNLWFYVFRAEDFGLRLPDEEWHIFEQEEWVGAVRRKKQNGVMIAFVGGRADMTSFLKEEAVAPARRTAVMPEE